MTPRAPFLGCLCVALLAAASAVAQTPAASAPAAPGAVLPAATSSVAPAEAEDATLQARERFAEATELYNAGHFAGALAQFERAYQLKPDFKVLYNIGQSYFQLRQYADARDAMTRYLSEGGARVDAERQAAVKTDLADLARRLAKLTLMVNVDGATVLVDGKNVGVTPLHEPLLVSEGERVISVEAPNRSALQRRIRIAGGEAQELTLDFADAPPSTALVSASSSQDASPRLGAAFWATAIGAVALGSGASVTGYLAFQVQDDNRRQRKTFGVTSAQLSDSNQRATSFALTTDVLGSAAVACAGVATVILMTSKRACSWRPNGAQRRSDIGCLEW